MPTQKNKIRITVDDGQIDGTVFAPTAKMPGVLFVHGWGGSQEQFLARAQKIAAMGCVCLTFDLRGHAGTKPQHETVSREKNLNDVIAAYDVLASHHAVDPDHIAVIGSSYGGYLGAILTSLRPVKWLALRVPALYMDRDWKLPKRQLHKGQALVAYRQHLIAADDNRALRACADFRGDVLVVESEFDHIIPRTVISSYLDACVHARSLTYRTIAGADHGLTEESMQQAYTTLLVNWLSEVVFAPRTGSTSAQAAVNRAGERVAQASQE